MPSGATPRVANCGLAQLRRRSACQHWQRQPRGRQNGEVRVERVVLEDEEVAAARKLVGRCSFAVWLPTFWPQEHGTPKYFVSERK